MEPDERSSTPRKVRFPPKPPSQRKTGSRSVRRTEKADRKEDDEAKKQSLQHLNEGTHQGPDHKAEDDAPIQPTFIHEAKQSSSNQELNIPQVGDDKQTENFDSDWEWDEESYYPTRLPWRKPGSVDPVPQAGDDEQNEKSGVTESAVESSVVMASPSDDSDSTTKESISSGWRCLPSQIPIAPREEQRKSFYQDIADEAEFGESAKKMEYNENAINPAKELGLNNPDETSEKARLLFFQFPPTLPEFKQSATAKGKEVVGSSGSSGLKGPSSPTSMNKGAQRSSSLNDLSEGKMGKMLVYGSGDVKLKLGDVLYDVSPGHNCTFPQEVVAINTQKKECCSIGTLNSTRAIVTPDLDSLVGDSDRPGKASDD